MTGMRCAVRMTRATSGTIKIFSCKMLPNQLIIKQLQYSLGDTCTLVSHRRIFGATEGALSSYYYYYYYYIVLRCRDKVSTLATDPSFVSPSHTPRCDAKHAPPSLPVATRTQRQSTIEALPYLGRSTRPPILNLKDLLLPTDGGERL